MSSSEAKWVALISAKITDTAARPSKGVFTRSGNIRQGGRKGHTGDDECVSAFVPVERKIYP
jgi:hypothetical protein